MRWATLAEARWILLALLAGAAVTVPWWRWTAVPWLAAFAFVLYFFRDPDRAAPAGAGDVAAPADGRVTGVDRVMEGELLGCEAWRVGIFLSVFDVHTNRAPLDGRVVFSEERVGEYLDARHPEATRRNACRTWGFQTSRGPVLVVRQITGAVARRIVAWSRVGDEVRRGERFGMIRFGSRTEIFLPLDSEVLVKPGDRVLGGETVIARLAEGGGGR